MGLERKGDTESKINGKHIVAATALVAAVGVGVFHDRVMSIFESDKPKAEDTRPIDEAEDEEEVAKPDVKDPKSKFYGGLDKAKDGLSEYIAGFLDAFAVSCQEEVLKANVAIDVQKISPFHDLINNLKALKGAFRDEKKPYDYELVKKVCDPSEVKAALKEFLDQIMADRRLSAYAKTIFIQSLMDVFSIDFPDAAIDFADYLKRLSMDPSLVDHKTMEKDRDGFIADLVKALNAVEQRSLEEAYLLDLLQLTGYEPGVKDSEIAGSIRVRQFLKAYSSFNSLNDERDRLKGIYESEKTPEARIAYLKAKKRSYFQALYFIEVMRLPNPFTDEAKKKRATIDFYSPGGMLDHLGPYGLSHTEDFELTGDEIKVLEDAGIDCSDLK